jgi:sugar lactone lactonase YvrE
VKSIVPPGGGPLDAVGHALNRTADPAASGHIIEQLQMMDVHGGWTGASARLADANALPWTDRAHRLSDLAAACTLKTGHWRNQWIPKILSIHRLPSKSGILDAFASSTANPPFSLPPPAMIECVIVLALLTLLVATEPAVGVVIPIVENFRMYGKIQPYSTMKTSRSLYALAVLSLLQGTVFAQTSAPSITTQPYSQTVAPATKATFTLVATGPLPLVYQWQRIEAGGSIWTNLSDNATYSGTGTGTLTVNSATVAMNGDLFRCVCTNSYGNATSSTAVLVVPTPLTVSTVAGQGGQSGGADGSGSTARFYGPTDIAVLSGSTTYSPDAFYIVDTYNHTIRKMTSAGVISTVAGAAGTSGSVDGTGTAARFNHPSGVTVDRNGMVYIADTDNNTVREMYSSGMVSTLAGAAGTSGSVDGTGTAARFNKPTGIAVDTAGNLYVADTLNHTIRKITSSGAVSTLAGAAGMSGSVDGVGSAARFYGPQGLALSSAGTPVLYVADANNSTIRQITLSTGSVVTWAGLAGATGNADGPGSVAQFFYPCGVTIDSAGNLYVADTDNHTIRVITSLGEVTTIAGRAGTSGSADGVDSAALFNHPTGIAVDSTGSLFVADTDNDTIRLGYFPAAPVITAQPQSQTVPAGNGLSFTVVASGKPTPTFQWYFNGTAISGATGSFYSVLSAQSAAGDYTVTVSNSVGSVTSNKATLTVTAAVPNTSWAPAFGGGGGGAPSLWFYGALSLLLAARRTFSRKWCSPEKA